MIRDKAFMDSLQHEINTQKDNKMNDIEMDLEDLMDYMTDLLDREEDAEFDNLVAERNQNQFMEDWVKF